MNFLRSTLLIFYFLTVRNGKFIKQRNELLDTVLDISAVNIDKIDLLLPRLKFVIAHASPAPPPCQIYRLIYSLTHRYRRYLITSSKQLTEAHDCFVNTD